MHPEIEIRFLDVDFSELRRKLRSAHAERKHHMCFMKRVIVDYADQRLQHGTPEAWVILRLRDEGDRTLLTYKQIAKSGEFATHEIETEVSSYENMIAIFEKLGLLIVSEQHTKREMWRLGACEVSLDRWPWLPPMVEIEGRDDDALQSVVAMLGLERLEPVPGDVVVAYRRMYPGMKGDESIREIPKLTYDLMPEWLKTRQRP